ncbi:hypothetical protein N9156_01090 [Akkermansiaceae bacterium]|nr:hypothetical protein [Akkermansiaceae bacterium]
MTMDELDALRGYGISAVLIGLVMVGAGFRFLPETALKAKAWLVGSGGLVGAVGGLSVFFLLSFISGWEEYFDEQSLRESSDQSPEYTGRHRKAAKVIRVLGDMEVSTLGIVFGVLGLYCFILCVLAIRTYRKS